MRGREARKEVLMRVDCFEGGGGGRLMAAEEDGYVIENRERCYLYQQRFMLGIVFHLSCSLCLPTDTVTGP